jgi:hypothetical protein
MLLVFVASSLSLAVSRNNQPSGELDEVTSSAAVEVAEIFDPF